MKKNPCLKPGGNKTQRRFHEVRKKNQSITCLQISINISLTRYWTKHFETSIISNFTSKLSEKMDKQIYSSRLF